MDALDAAIAKGLDATEAFGRSSAEKLAPDASWLDAVEAARLSVAEAPAAAPPPEDAEPTGGALEELRNFKHLGLAFENAGSTLEFKWRQLDRREPERAFRAVSKSTIAWPGPEK